MRATAIVPIKRFDAAKQRLSETLAPAQRALLAGAMADDVLAALGRAATLERVLVVSGEPRLGAIAARRGCELLDDPDDRGHSQAALIGIEAALEAGSGCVAVLPADCPLLDPAELDAAIAAVADGTAAVVPDRHGSGTNGLLLRPPDAIEPAFGPGSRERHLQAASAAGVEGTLVEIDSLALDLDTRGDLHELRARLAGAAPQDSATAAALRTIEAEERA